MILVMIFIVIVNNLLSFLFENLMKNEKGTVCGCVNIILFMIFTLYMNGMILYMASNDEFLFPFDLLSIAMLT